MDIKVKLPAEVAVGNCTTGKLVADRVTRLVNIAATRRIRVDGLHLVDGLLTDKQIKKLEQTVFADAVLDGLDRETKRIEFIYEGRLPMELREETELKQEIIFTKIPGAIICFKEAFVEI